MGLRPSPYLVSLNERETADLLYPDNSRIKHHQSMWLEAEVAEKSSTLPSPALQLTLPKASSPLIKALVDHLKRVSSVQPGQARTIVFAASKAWVKDMLGMMQSSLLKPPSRSSVSANVTTDVSGKIEDWSATLEDESSVLESRPAASSTAVALYETSIVPSQNHTDDASSRSFSCMTHISSQQLPNFSQANTSQDPYGLSLDDSRFFFTVVSENMNSYTLLGTPSVHFDLMVQPYIPAIQHEVTEDMVLVSHGLPLTLRLLDKSFSELDQSMSVWKSDCSVQLLTGPQKSMSRMCFIWSGHMLFLFREGNGGLVLSKTNMVLPCVTYIHIYTYVVCVLVCVHCLYFTMLCCNSTVVALVRRL